MRFGKAVVKHRIFILILTAALLVPSVFGMIGTRVNYDMLTYLPEDIDTVIGQNELLKDFNKGAFTFLIFEDKILCRPAGLRLQRRGGQLHPSEQL